MEEAFVHDCIFACRHNLFQSERKKRDNDTDLNGKVMFRGYLPEYEGCDSIGCIALICVVLNDKSSMQFRLMIFFMPVLQEIWS